MSKKSSSFARDIQVGDVIRLVYEVEVHEIGDLDAKYPSESSDLHYINGKVVKGPLHRKNIEVEFAIYGEDKLVIVSRKSMWQKFQEAMANYRNPPKKARHKEKMLPPPIPERHNKYSNLF